MFEDFENRMGFWKNLGSNFTINYSGSNPSFLTSGELWESLDSGTTQTLDAWENGWVLTNNPDGTMTANPKYTSGLAPEILVRVPVGPQSPNAVQPSTGGGVVVAAENKTFHGFGGIEIPIFNKISTSHTCHGGHRGRMGYIIEYSNPNTELNSRGANSLEDAIADSMSGERSDSTLYSIYSYWEKDSALASGKPMPTNDAGRFGVQKNKEANYCDEPEGHKEDDYDPNDCASEHRAVNDETCGDCQTGYSEDADGNCIADETEETGTNWLMMGGIAALAAFAFLG